MKALEQLAVRILGHHASLFRFEQSKEKESDVFELRHEGDHVSVKGSDGPAMAAGLYWYLTHCAGGHVSWHGSHLGRVADLPALPQPVVRRKSWGRYRYFLNYCCFSYSLAYWDWEKWEHLIDWMALHGVNLPLSVTGLEAVWQRVCMRLGLSEEETQDFLPGAAFLPFGWMGCLDGWTGPLSDHWIEEHERLGQRILARQRELGMTPVVQGFSGHVPSALSRLFPEVPFQKIRWLEWETYLLDPMDPLFSRVASLFMEEHRRSFGTDHFYAVDPFIEMIPPSGESDYLAKLALAIFGGLADSDSEAVWVLQGWPFHYNKSFWTPPRLEAFLNAVSDERMLLLDLFCEAYPMWSHTQGFYGKPWLWCNIQSFGRNVVLTGALETNNHGLADARRDPMGQNLHGIGMVNEGLCQNPVAYEFLFERAWEEDPVDLKEWGRGFAECRYGAVVEPASEAWAILCATVCSRFRVEESGLVRCPSLEAQIQAPEENQALLKAWNLLLDAADVLRDRDTFRFDLVHVGRQVMSNLGNAWKKEMHDAIAMKDVAAFEQIARRIRGLLEDFEELLSGHPDFHLRPWVKSAEDWGQNAAEKHLLRQGALRQITLWGDGVAMELRDYARKEWAGLIRDFYLPRWEAWFVFAAQALASGDLPDGESYRQQMVEWEKQWIDRSELSDTPVADAIKVSRKFHAKYGDLLQ